jgi:hypothetical protein
VHKIGNTGRAIAIATVVSIVVGVLISWFAWTAKEMAPRDVPVVAAGPVPPQVAQGLEHAGFAVTTVADATAADQALRDRTAYAAFLVGPSGLEVHTASAAGPAVAQIIGAAAANFKATVTDVVPGSADDPHGTGFASGFLPLVLIGMVGGVLLTLLVPSNGARLLGLGLLAIFAGLLGAGLLHWLGVLTGPYAANAGVIALVALAVSGTVAGLAAVIGRAGIALGAVVVFLFATPISGVQGAPQLLPKPWGEVGQFLPPGAGATLLRSSAFFDGAGSMIPLLTLAGWAVLGVVLVAVGRRRSHLDLAVSPEPVPAA